MSNLGEMLAKTNNDMRETLKGTRRERDFILILVTSDSVIEQQDGTGRSIEQRGQDHWISKVVSGEKDRMRERKR